MVSAVEPPTQALLRSATHYRASSQAVSFVTRVRDLVTLTKPRITAMVVMTTFGGMWLATRATVDAEHVYEAINWETALFAVGGTALVVAAANAFNMFLERDSDRLMERTKNRPLPTGRMPAWTALGVACALSLFALPVLAFTVNFWTAALATIALVSYAFIYTPLKRKTTLALPIGAVPGAIPPLLGWTAVTGTIQGPGVLLFSILFLWQLPHFLAIATYRKDEYRRAGLKVLPVERGERITRHHIVRYLAALVLASLLLVPYGVGGPVYLYVALIAGAAFFGVGAWGLRRTAGPIWAKRLFLSSLVYLTLLFVAFTL